MRRFLSRLNAIASRRGVLAALIALVLLGGIEDDRGCEDSHPKGSDFPSSPTTPSTYTYTQSQLQ